MTGGTGGSRVEDHGARGRTALADETAGRLFVALALLTRRLRRDDPTPLGPGSISALATVVGEGPIRLGDLAAIEGVRAPTMTRIIDLLVNEGYAERVPDPGDGRACLVRATAAGTAVVSGARGARSDLLGTRLRRLSTDDLAALYAALPAIEALCLDDA